MKKKILIAILATLISAGGVVGVVVSTSNAHVNNASSSQSESVSDFSSSHVHAFTIQSADSKYLKREATCTAKAVYYYSCECGATDTQTFEYGEINPDAHTYGVWISNGNGTHTKTCTNDTTHTVTENCNGGTASCIEKATCKDCGAKYGTLKEHEYNKQNVAAKYLKSEATCTAKAVYYYSCECGDKGSETFEYGEFADHTYSWDYNDTHHWQEATCGCDVPTKNNAEHTLNDDGVCTLCDNPISATAGVSYILSDDETYYSVDDYTGTATRVRIAESYNGLPVKEITEMAFYDNTTVTKVIIPSSITAINVSAFKGCTNLTSITIPDSVTSIGIYAFYGCSNLTSVTIPNSVTSIGNYVFYGCSNLTSVTIPNSVTSIGNYVFYGCSNLTSITIPDSVTSIGESAFGNCYIETAIIPAMACKYINKNKLKTVTITSGDSIDNSAFQYCHNLTSVTIGNSVPSIGDSAFRNCNSLTSITIPNSVTWIGNGAFSDCTALTSVTIGNNVTSIGSSAFYNCKSLANITIPDSVTSIGSSAFYGCDKLIIKNKGVHYVDNWLVDADSTITSAKIKDGTRGIANYAFYGCSSLKNMTIPFVGASKDATGYQAVFGYIFGYTTKLSSSLTSGATYQYCDSSSSSSFKYYHYYIPTSLTKVTITGGNIPYQAFYNCSSLKSVTIGNGVTSIGDSAFEDCKSLTSITIPDSVTSIGNDAFYGCKALTSVTIPDGVTSIGGSAFSGCTALTSVTIPDSVTSIGDSAFYNCSSLTSITIPDSVTLIGSDAFYNCSSLTSITIPDSVTSIGNDAFYGCKALTSVNYTGTIDDWVQINFVDYYSNPLTYAKKLYINNELVTNANITTATKISAIAFYCYESLTSVTIGDGVTLIGDAAFYGCDSLTNVYYKGTIDEWNKIAIDSYNSNLTSATRYYYSETQPTSSGNYWHYDTDGITPVVWNKTEE